MHAGGRGTCMRGVGGDMHARLLPSRLQPDWELGQIARLPPPVCRQIAFDYPVCRAGTADPAGCPGSPKVHPVQSFKT